MSSHNHNVETDSDILSHAFWSNLYNHGPTLASVSVTAALAFDTEKLNSSVLYWVNTRDTA